jgi:hypothetical protein
VVYLKSYDIVEWGFAISTMGRRGESYLDMLDDQLDTLFGKSSIGLSEFLTFVKDVRG